MFESLKTLNPLCSTSVRESISLVELVGVSSTMGSKPLQSQILIRYTCNLEAFLLMFKIACEIDDRKVIMYDFIKF